MSGFGRRLMHLTYSVLQKEADLRFALVRVLCVQCHASCSLRMRSRPPCRRHAVPAAARGLPSQSVDHGVGTSASMQQGQLVARILCAFAVFYSHRTC